MPKPSNLVAADDRRGRRGEQPAPSRLSRRGLIRQLTLAGEAMSIIANGLGLRVGDEVRLANQEHGEVFPSDGFDPLQTGEAFEDYGPRHPC